MDPTLLPRSIVIGFAIAAPVGPIGILVIRRTLLEGRLVGLVSGAGAATADTFYAALAAFGLTFISSTLMQGSAWIRLLGGIFLWYIGLTTMLSRPAERTPASPRARLGGAYGSTVFLTITNPATILSFVAVFAGLGAVGRHGSYASAALLVPGVSLGSLLWWFMLSAMVSTLRGRLTTTALHLVNVLAGLTILAFGGAAMGSVAAAV